MIHPVELARTDEGVRIAFSDGSVRRITGREIQRACPCANCKERRDADAARPPDPLALLAPEARPGRIVGMRPVGRYAYHIDFSQGCSRGIYEFDLLRSLGRPEESTPSDEAPPPVAGADDGLR